MTEAWEILQQGVCEDDAGLVAAALDAGAWATALISVRWPGLQSVSSEEAWFAAAGLGATNAMRVMLDRGAAKPDAHDSRRETALHRAALYAQPEAVKLLLLYGADPHAETYGGHTPSTIVEQRRGRGAFDIPEARDAAVRALLEAAGVEGLPSGEAKSPDEVIEEALEELECRIDKQRVNNAQEADEAGAEIAAAVADRYGYQMGDRNYERLMAAMMEKAGKEFPGEWGEDEDDEEDDEEEDDDEE